MSLRERSIPVYVTPMELKLFVETPETHKQTLTLCNPDQFAIKYKTFSNAGNKYSVIEPSGIIERKSTVELLIKHNVPKQEHCNCKDKIKIVIYDAHNDIELGSRIVRATLLPGEKEDESVENYSESNAGSHIRDTRERVRNPAEADVAVQRYFLVVSVLCIMILFLPTKCEPQEGSAIPAFLHINVPLKTVTSYILGLITMALLRPR